jgi:hypothetical protein
LTEFPQILFAGGCHLNGFPVGPEHSLARVALRSIGHPAAENPSVLAYVNLRSNAALKEACVKQRTEILVLQLGHYETLPKLKKMFHAGSSSSLSSGSSPSLIRELAQNPNLSFVPTLGARAIFARRLLLGAAFRGVGLGKRVFDPAALEASLDGLLTDLRSLPLKAILLLSPFSCPDPLTRTSRRHAAQLFAAAAGRHGCVFVDAFNLLESCGEGQPFCANFADANHLSRVGHERVGRFVGEALRSTIATVEGPAPNGRFGPFVTPGLK